MARPSQEVGRVKSDGALLLCLPACRVRIRQQQEPPWRPSGRRGRAGCPATRSSAVHVNSEKRRRRSERRVMRKQRLPLPRQLLLVRLPKVLLLQRHATRRFARQLRVRRRWRRRRPRRRRLRLQSSTLRRDALARQLRSTAPPSLHFHVAATWRLLPRVFSRGRRGRMRWRSCAKGRADGCTRG